MVRLPAAQQLYPQILRQAGYYCANNVKEDYNLEKPGQIWDDSSREAHWRNRKQGQPFFAVFNSEKSHESKLRIRPHVQIHDPAKVRVPGYHPDTPEVRQDWAQYYDTLTEADADAGKRLQEIEDAGLLEDTIVFYYADHGSGMPRNKRWPYNSGLHVPLVVYIPEKFRHLAPPEYTAGGKSDRLVSFVDFPPALLSLAGIKPPEWMHGHAFMGPYHRPPQPYLFGFRGRMDERYDLVRSVTDGRYVYVRNYMPHKIYGQHVAYMFETPATKIWKQLHDEGKLNPAQDTFWKTKAPEELYDLGNDPDEVTNLAASPAHQGVRKRLRQAQQDLARSVCDLGFLPEGELFSRSQEAAPYDMGHDPEKYPFEKIFRTAEMASELKMEDLPTLKAWLKDSDSAVRYWSALGILMRGKAGVAAANEVLRRALQDSSPFVRIVAAEALGCYGSQEDLKQALDVLANLGGWDKNGVFVAMAALNAIDALGSRATPIRDAIKTFPIEGRAPDARYNPYVPRLVEDLLARFR
jgi:uncharacterized sulfatase